MNINIPDLETPCCHDPFIIINYDGLQVCQNCGTVVMESVFVDDLERSYTIEQLNQRRHSEPKWKQYGPRTTIGNTNEMRQTQLYSRLSKINASLVTSFERNISKSMFQINEIADRLCLPSHVIGTGFRIYNEVARQGMTRGRSIQSAVLATMFVTMRTHEIPFFLKDLLVGSPMNLNHFHHILSEIVQSILPKLGLTYKPAKLSTIVYRIGQELNIEFNHQQMAIKLITRAIHHGFIHYGKDPKGIAAAAIYLILQYFNIRITQGYLSSIADITEVTLRARVKMLQQFLPTQQCSVFI